MKKRITAIALFASLVFTVTLALPAFADESTTNRGSAPQALDQTAGAGSDRAAAPDHGTPTAGQPEPSTATEAERTAAGADHVEDATTLAADHKAATCPCPGCPMKGASDDKNHSAKMFMDAELAPNDPAVLIALRDDLNLTADQVNRLDQIRRETKTRTEEVLSSDQKQKLAAMPNEPMSVRAWHEAHGIDMDNDKHHADKTTASVDRTDAIDVTPDSQATRPNDDNP